jgi:hypothetical protein
VLTKREPEYLQVRTDILRRIVKPKSTRAGSEADTDSAGTAEGVDSLRPGVRS